MRQVIIGLVATPSQADALIGRLTANDIPKGDIAFLMSDAASIKDLSCEKHSESKASEGATAGAGTGLVLGGTLGWLAGTGALSIPEGGSLIAGGAMTAALSGAALGGTIGGLLGELIGLGIPDFEATGYEGKLSDGNITVSVQAANNEMGKVIAEILKAGGARDVTCTSQTAVE